MNRKIFQKKVRVLPQIITGKMRKQDESQVKDIDKIQQTLLKNLNLKVKNRQEPEEVEKDEFCRWMTANTMKT
jgi:hypothetical protein